MAEAVRVSNMPDGGSPERVAYDIWWYLKGLVPSEAKGNARVKGFLDLYAACLDTVKTGETPDLTRLFS
jgi:hypothetical protein